MLPRAHLKILIDEWRAVLNDSLTELIPRSLNRPLPSPKHALGLIGVRRCGKSWHAMEVAKVHKAKTLYINFEDPAFFMDSGVDNLSELLSVYEEFYNGSPALVIFDEIQNIPGWERWVRKSVESRAFPLIITGSSAKLLSSEISTSVAGRCLEEKIWPLSYKEFLDFKKVTPPTAPAHMASLREYLQWGGFPEVVLEKKTANKKLLLLQYGQDLVAKDIINRHEVRNKRVLDQIFVYYSTHCSCLHSYNSVRKGFQITADLVADYTRFLNEAFFCFEVSRFHKNMKVQIRDAKKIYLIDTGLRNVFSSSIEKDTGRLIENVVFLELLRRGKTVQYFSNEKECDFVVTHLGEPKDAIQVCYDNLHSKETLSREINGLMDALTSINLKEGTIITLNRHETIRVKNKSIHFIPLYRWLLPD